MVSPNLLLAGSWWRGHCRPGCFCRNWKGCARTAVSNSECFLQDFSKSLYQMVYKKWDSSPMVSAVGAFKDFFFLNLRSWSTLFSLGPHIPPSWPKGYSTWVFPAHQTVGVHRFPTTNPLTPTQPSSPRATLGTRGGKWTIPSPEARRGRQRQKERPVTTGRAAVPGWMSCLNGCPVGWTGLWTDQWVVRINGCRWLQRCGSRIALRRIGLETGENDGSSTVDGRNPDGVYKSPNWDCGTPSKWPNLHGL